MNKRIFYGKVENCRLILWEEDDFKQYYKSLDGKPIMLSIGRAYAKRTVPQNAYMWGCVYKIIAGELGWTDDEAHEFCKNQFNSKHKTISNKTTGTIEDVEVAGSTADMSTTDFMAYIEKIQMFFASHGIVVPDPNQSEFL